MKVSSCLLLLVVLLAVFRTAAQSPTCPPGEYRYTSSRCVHCASCDPATHPNCNNECYCANTAACPNASSNFCQLYESSRRGTIQMCESCSASCSSGYDSPYEAPLDGTQAKSGYADCPTSCVCTQHSDCPSGEYCGRSSQGHAPNVCHKCNRCINQFSVNGSCPLGRCAANVQCQQSSDCAVSSDFCTMGFQCRQCSSDCYVMKHSRANRYIWTGATANVTCPKDCCGWNSLYRGSTAIRRTAESFTSTHVHFTMGLCEAEAARYSYFYAVKRETSQLIEPYDSTLDACRVTVDENPDAYPRKVVEVLCDFVDQCDDVTQWQMMVYGGMPNGTRVELVYRNYTVDTRSDSCGLRTLLWILLGVLIVGVLCCVGAIVACCFCCCRSGRRSAPAQPTQTSVAVVYPAQEMQAQPQPQPQPQPEVQVVLGEPVEKQAAPGVNPDV